MSNILYAKHNDAHVLKFVGEVRVNLGPTLMGFLSSIDDFTESEAIIIDLRETICIDSTSLGLLAKISLRSQAALHKKPTIVSTNVDVTRILHNMGFESIFAIDENTPVNCQALNDLPIKLASEPELRDQVIDAHKTLMKLNAKNQRCFCELVDALESEKTTMAQSKDQSNASLPAFEARKAG